MQNSTNTFEMSNGVTVIMDFAPMDYVMNPETDDLIRGDRLRDGMIVLLESFSMRQSGEHFANPKTLPYNRQRALETSRWCTVTDMRTRGYNGHDIMSFIGLYADGTKFERTYGESHCWFVKLDSMPAEGPVVEGIFTDTINGVTLDNARAVGIIRPIPSHDVMVPDVEGLFVDGFEELTLDRARELGYIRPILPRVFAKPLGPLVIFDDSVDNDEETMPKWEQDGEDGEILEGLNADEREPVNPAMDDEDEQDENNVTIPLVDDDVEIDSDAELKELGLFVPHSEGLDAKKDRIILDSNE